MEKLRIDSGVKKIEVNDAGECISIPINDSMFYERFSGFLNWLDRKHEEYRKRSEETAENGSESTKKGSVDIREVVSEQTKLSKEICVELDKLFGEGCCRKVFVDTEVPTLDLIDDFLEQITPLLEKFAKERNEKINLKYSRRRKGANSK